MVARFYRDFANPPLACEISPESLLMNAVVLLWLAALSGHMARSQDSLPIKIPQVRSTQCPVNVSDYFTETLESDVNQFLNEKYGPPCKCGGDKFQRAVYLNMSNPSTQCPPNWRLYNDNAVRGCRPTLTVTGCSSAVFSITVPYNRVCGRISGYQDGTPDAFDQIYGSTLNIEEHYVDGVSLTYGPHGFRRHIWTFAASKSYADQGYKTSYNCECTNTKYAWNHTLPSFVGNNYFCESGSHIPGSHGRSVFTDDPLWDGRGCASTSTCCGLNTPPWFCATLSQTITENLEIRICKDQASSDEDIILSLIDIYVSTY